MSDQAGTDRLPQLAQVAGPSWLRRPPDWFSAYVAGASARLLQLERDLSLLASKVPAEDLVRCYSAMLRDHQAFLQTAYEIHGAALLASVASRIELHVPRVSGSNRNFDVRAEILGHTVNAESKTRTDEFPFNVPDDPKVLFGMRQVLDPHDAADLGISVDRETADGVWARDTPESTVIRQLLLEGLAQLPESGCNVVMFGHNQGDRAHLERALFGSEFAVLSRNQATKEVTIGWRHGPGAFTSGETGEPFRLLSGVLWTRLMQISDGSLVRAYDLYLNPGAEHQIPGEVADALGKAIAQWRTSAHDEGAGIGGLAS